MDCFKKYKTEGQGIPTFGQLGVKIETLDTYVSAPTHLNFHMVRCRFQPRWPLPEIFKPFFSGFLVDKLQRPSSQNQKIIVFKLAHNVLSLVARKFS